MKYYIPKDTKAYLQTNRSNIIGNLWSTRGIDLQTNLGAMKLSSKLVINTDSTDDADLGRPCAFENFAQRWWAICGTRVFSNTSEDISVAFTEDASSGAETDYNPLYSDLGVFNSRLWATTQDTLLSKSTAAGAWTSRDTLSLNTVHKIAYFKKFDRLYYGYSDTSVRSIGTSDVVASAGDYFINLGDSVQRITTLVATSNSIFIGMGIPTNSSSANGTKAVILEWDGISAQVSNEYTLNAGACIAMTVYQNIPYAVDSEGRILKYTGYSFEEIGRLPIINFPLLGATGETTTGKFVHYNGLTSTKNNTLLVAVNNYEPNATGTVRENLPSGVWEIDLTTGNCTHRFPITLKPLDSSSVTDYGQNLISGIGAIKVNYLSYNSPMSAGKSNLLLGATVYTNATDTLSSIYVLSPEQPTTDTEGQKKGYFVSTWLESNEVVNEWNRIWSVYKKFRNASDNIEYKYRLSEEEPTYATITWTSTTTFTTTTDVSAYSPNATGFNGTVGGEVEVLQGTGSGDCVHVSSITENAGTYTVTLERAVTGVTGTAKARFQKWIKVFPAVPVDTVNSFSQFQIGGTDTRIQIKCCLTWTGDGEYYKSIITSNDKIIATA